MNLAEMARLIRFTRAVPSGMEAGAVMYAGIKVGIAIAEVDPYLASLILGTEGQESYETAMFAARDIAGKHEVTQ